MKFLILFLWAWEIKARRAGDSEQLNSRNPQSTNEHEDKHKHTPITTQVEETKAHLFKSGEVRVRVPEVLCGTSTMQASRDQCQPLASDK